MPEYTYVVTQRVEYYDPLTFDTPEALIEWINTGDGWDHKHNQVRSDRVEVYDVAGDQVYDTAPEVVTVWTATVVTPDSRYIATSVHASEQEAHHAMRENHDPEGECDEQTIEELASYFSLDLTFEPHVVTLP